MGAPGNNQAQQLAMSNPGGFSQRQMEQVRAYLAQQGMVGDFNRGTRQSYLTQPSVLFSQGQVQRVNMPQTGYLSDLFGIATIVVTTAAASTTTVKTYIPYGYGLMRTLKLKNNQGVDVWNTSGWGMVLEAIRCKYAYGAFTPQAGTLSQLLTGGVYPAATALPSTRYFNPVVSQIASTVNTFKLPVWMPIAWGPSLQAGLQLLQDPSIQYQLEVGWGDSTDLFSATTGTVTLSGIQLLPSTLLYHVPERAVDLPKLSFTKTVIEDQQALTAGTGENTYKFVTGNMAENILLEYINTPSGTQTPIAPSAVTRVKMRYSQTQIPYDCDADSWIFRQDWLYGQNLPSAVYSHELGQPNGLPELVGVRDIVNTARLTDLDLITTLSGVTLENGFVRGIRSQLVKNR